MNIVVRTFSGKIIVRPDTTWVRKDEDFYVPDFIDSLSAAPVLCARISRPGKCISQRFAERYYDTVGEGLLLYPENLIDSSPESFACASCIGHTTYIKMPEKDKNGFDSESRQLICCALAEASVFALVRTGDIIAVETAARSLLCHREDKVFKSENFSIIF